MKSRWAIGVAGATLLVVPLLVVHAQTTTPESTTEDPIAEAPITEAPPVGDATTSEASSAESAPPVAVEPVATGEVLGVTVEATEDPALETESATSSESTASSTEPIIPQTVVTETRTVFLQTAVDIGSHLQVGPVTANITLSNLTCRYCGSSSPSATIKAYYTQWYDNDGSAPGTTTEHMLEQTYTISAISPWQSSSVQWTGEIATAGRYSFIVEVDPDNSIGARDTYRTEFFVD